MKKILLCIFCLLFLTGCKKNNGNTNYVSIPAATDETTVSSDIREQETTEEMESTCEVESTCEAIPETESATSYISTTMATIAETTSSSEILKSTTIAIKTTEIATTTVVPTTEIPTTVAPATEAPTTEATTTEAPTTVAPTTEVPTTAAPTTAAPTTVAPTTAPVIPTTIAPTKSPSKCEVDHTAPVYDTITELHLSAGNLASSVSWHATNDTPGRILATGNNGVPGYTDLLNRSGNNSIKSYYRCCASFVSAVLIDCGMLPYGWGGSSVECFYLVNGKHSWRAPYDYMTNDVDGNNKQNTWIQYYPTKISDIHPGDVVYDVAANGNAVHVAIVGSDKGNNGHDWVEVCQASKNSIDGDPSLDQSAWSTKYDMAAFGLNGSPECSCHCNKNYHKEFFRYVPQM